MISKKKIKELAREVTVTDSFASEYNRHDFTPDEIVALKEELFHLTGKCYRINALKHGAYRDRLWFVTSDALKKLNIKLSYIHESELCELFATNDLEDYDEIISTLKATDKYVCKRFSLKRYRNDASSGYGGVELSRLRKLIMLETGKDCHIFMYDGVATIKTYTD